jgi:hypothetical protein
LGDGPCILWIDNPYDDSMGVQKGTRINVRAYDGDGNPLVDEQGNKQYDLRLWRFSKTE